MYVNENLVVMDIQYYNGACFIVRKTTDPRKAKQNIDGQARQGIGEWLRRRGRCERFLCQKLGWVQHRFSILR